MNQNPPWEADSNWASQEASRMLWNPNVDHCVHKTPPPVVMSWIPGQSKIIKVCIISGVEISGSNISYMTRTVLLQCNAICVDTSDIMLQVQRLRNLRSLHIKTCFKWKLGV